MYLNMIKYIKINVIALFSILSYCVYLHNIKQSNLYKLLYVWLKEK